MLFPDSNLSSFWPIFFKLCVDIDIREEWFGIANGLISLINNRVTALDWCKNEFCLNIFRTNRWILIKFCICIDKYKIHVVPNARYFGQLLTELWPVIDVRILFMLNILWINLWISIKFCVCIRYFSAELCPLIDVRILFAFNILRTNWWILMKFCVCSTVTSTWNFPELFNRVVALDWC